MQAPTFDASSTPMELLKEFTQCFERRQRNLMKRKSKLDTYREKLAKGEQLRDEQKKAVEGYDGVLHSVQILQEILIQTNEFTSNLEASFKRRDAEVEHEHEEYTIDFLPNLICIQRFLSELDSPSVRLAVKKATSEQQLCMLDRVRQLLTCSLESCVPDNGVTAQEAPKNIKSHTELKHTSSYAFKLAIGEASPIPLLQEHSGSKRHWTFRDARHLCFRLMSNTFVQRALGVCVVERTKSLSVSSTPSINGSAEQEESGHTNGTAVTHEVTEEPISPPSDTAAQGVPNAEMHKQVTHTGRETVIDRVIEPLRSSFNFLQVSQVSSIPMPAAKSDAATHAEQLAGSDCVQLGSSNCEVKCEPAHSFHKEFHTVPVEHEAYHAQSMTASYLQPQNEHAVSALVEVDGTETFQIDPSKPVSYADSVRKPGNRPNVIFRPYVDKNVYDNLLRNNQTTDEKTTRTYGAFNADGRNFRGRARVNAYAANRGTARGRGGSQRGAGNMTNQAEGYGNMRVGVPQPTY